MRIDMLLNKLCLVKTRSIAKKAADKGLIKINGMQAKAASLVSENCEIEFEIYGYKTKLKLIKIPKGNVAKKNANEYYELVNRTKIDMGIQ